MWAMPWRAVAEVSGACVTLKTSWSMVAPKFEALWSVDDDATWARKDWSKALG